jgi:hypothetical protein
MAVADGYSDLDSVYLDGELVQPVGREGIDRMRFDPIGDIGPGEHQVEIYIDDELHRFTIEVSPSAPLPDETGARVDILGVTDYTWDALSQGQKVARAAAVDAVQSNPSDCTNFIGSQQRDDCGDELGAAQGTVHVRFASGGSDVIGFFVNGRFLHDSCRGAFFDDPELVTYAVTPTGVSSPQSFSGDTEVFVPDDPGSPRFPSAAPSTSTCTLTRAGSPGPSPAGSTVAWLALSAALVSALTRRRCLRAHKDSNLRPSAPEGASGRLLGLAGVRKWSRIFGNEQGATCRIHSRWVRFGEVLVHPWCTGASRALGRRVSATPLPALAPRGSAWWRLRLARCSRCGKSLPRSA